MELFVKIFNRYKPLTTVTKKYILNYWIRNLRGKLMRVCIKMLLGPHEISLLILNEFK